MNNELEKDYLFHINWEDQSKNFHRVGFLAKISQNYYFVVTNDNQLTSAYKRGFIGIPGFQSGKIYKSSQLFDFFKNRILDKTNANLCEELIKTGGKSMTDSYSLEEVNAKIAPKYMEILLEAYELQQAKREQEAQKNEEIK